MFQSHLDEAPVMNMPSTLGQDPSESQVPVPADQGSKDLATPQLALTLQKWKPVLTIAAIAVVTFVIVNAASKKKKKKS